MSDVTAIRGTLVNDVIEAKVCDVDAAVRRRCFFSSFHYFLFFRFVSILLFVFVRLSLTLFHFFSFSVPVFFSFFSQKNFITDAMRRNQQRTYPRMSDWSMVALPTSVVSMLFFRRRRDDFSRRRCRAQRCQIAPVHRRVSRLKIRSRIFPLVSTIHIRPFSRFAFRGSPLRVSLFLRVPLINFASFSLSKCVSVFHLYKET